MWILWEVYESVAFEVKMTIIGHKDTIIYVSCLIFKYLFRNNFASLLDCFECSIIISVFSRFDILFRALKICNYFGLSKFWYPYLCMFNLRSHAPRVLWGPTCIHIQSLTWSNDIAIIVWYMFTSYSYLNIITFKWERRWHRTLNWF